MNLTNLLCVIYNLLLFVSFVSAYILPTNQDFITNNKKTWIDAENHCQSEHNSHLLSIHDSFTFSQIRAEIHAIGKDTEDFWIGLVNTNPNLTNGNEPEYEWSDSSPFNYGTDLSGTFPWFDERPEAPSVDTKVRLWGGSASLLWDDTPETNTYFWVCNDSPTTLAPTMFPTVSPILVTISPTKSTKSGGLSQKQTTTQIAGGGGGGAVYVQPATEDEMDDINLFWKLAIIAVLIFSLCVLAYLCHTKLNDAWSRFKSTLSIQQISHSFSTRVQSLSQQFKSYRNNRRYTSDSRIMEEIAATRRPGHYRSHHGFHNSRKPPPPPPKKGGYHRNFSTPANSPYPDNSTTNGVVSPSARMRMTNRLQVPANGHNYDQTAESVISTPTIATVQGQSTTLKSQESAPSSMISAGSNSLGPPEPNTQPPSNDIFDELPIKLTSPTVKLSLSNIAYKKHYQHESELQITPVLIPNSQSSYHQYNHDVAYDEYNDEEEGSLNERIRRQYYTTPKGEDKAVGGKKMREINESKSTIISDGGVNMRANSRLLRDVSFNVDEYKRHHEEKQNQTMIQPIHALLIQNNNGQYSITPTSGDHHHAPLYEQDENKKDIISAAPTHSSTLQNNNNKMENKLSPSKHAKDATVTEDEIAAHSVYVAGRILAHKYIMDKLATDHENWSNASLTSGEEEEDTVNGHGQSVFSPIGNRAYNTMSVNVGLKRFDSKILEDLHEESQFDGDTLTKLPSYDDSDHDIDAMIDEIDGDINGDVDGGKNKKRHKKQEFHDAMEEEEDLDEEDEDDDDAALTIIMTPGRDTRGPSASTAVKTEIYRGDTEHYIELDIAPETTDGETQDDEDEDEDDDDDDDDDTNVNNYSHSDAVGHYRDETYTMN